MGRSKAKSNSFGVGLSSVVDLPLTPKSPVSVSDFDTKKIRLSVSVSEFLTPKILVSVSGVRETRKTGVGVSVGVGVEF